MCHRYESVLLSGVEGALCRQDGDDLDEGDLGLGLFSITSIQVHPSSGYRNPEPTFCKSQSMSGFTARRSLRVLRVAKARFRARGRQSVSRRLGPRSRNHFGTSSDACQRRRILGN